MKELTTSEYKKLLNENLVLANKIIYDIYRDSEDYLSIRRDFILNTIDLLGKFETKEFILTYDIEKVMITDSGEHVVPVCNSNNKEIELIRHGKYETLKSLKVTKINELFKVYTVKEASKIWNITEGAIRYAIEASKLKEFLDYRKSGRITLITKEAMIKVFGEPIDISEILYQNNLKLAATLETDGNGFVAEWKDEQNRTNSMEIVILSNCITVTYGYMDMKNKEIKFNTIKKMNDTIKRKDFWDYLKNIVSDHNSKESIKQY